MVAYIVGEKYIELYFDNIPGDNIRESLKVCGWRWIKNKRCWSNFKNHENIVWAKALCEDLNPKRESNLLQLERCVFSAENLLIRSNGFYCNLHHDVEDMAGEINICNKQGTIETYLVSIAYCRSCGTYFILEESFAILKKKGIIMSQIMTYKEYREYGAYNDDFGKWREKSPLRLWGYTVNQEEGYSDIQRQIILEDIIDCGKMTKDRLLSYLDFFIRMNGYKEDEALQKWKEDREHISAYKLGTARRVKIGSITVIDKDYR